MWAILAFAVLGQVHCTFKVTTGKDHVLRSLQVWASHRDAHRVQPLHTAAPSLSKKRDHAKHSSMTAILVVLNVALLITTMPICVFLIAIAPFHASYVRFTPKVSWQLIDRPTSYGWHCSLIYYPCETAHVFLLLLLWLVNIHLPVECTFVSASGTTTIVAS